MSQTHIHHVIPRSRGGTDEQTNLVEIDFIEHARLHAEDFLNGGPRFDFRHAGWPYLEKPLREAVLEQAAKDTRQKNLSRETPCALGSKHSEESRRIRSEKMKGENNPMFGRRTNNHVGISCPEHVKEILSNLHKGNKYRQGKPWTEEERKHHIQERTGKVWWVNTETGQTSKSKTCPGPKWVRGRKLLSN